MGVSIFSGTMTTFCAGMALFGAKVLTFQKFALIITCTILISFLTSMLFFGALLHTFGPQHGWCDLCNCRKDKELAEFKKKQKDEYDTFSSRPKTFYDLAHEGGIDSEDDQE